uniref:Uncharacterized protein n=1 Tax=Rhizophora mucronata TaxID=61149 RepID=A0A2P2IYJ5_RHIMU
MKPAFRTSCGANC